MFYFYLIGHSRIWDIISICSIYLKFFCKAITLLDVDLCASLAHAHEAAALLELSWSVPEQEPSCELLLIESHNRGMVGIKV